MWMTDYIKEIQKQFITKYGFKKNSAGLPVNVPDGEYSMKIEGKLDYVRIKDGKINCCNFKKTRKK